MGQEDKIIWIVVIALLFLSAIALGFYFSLKDSSQEKVRDFLAGNVINEGSETTSPIIQEPTLSKSIVLDV